MRIYNYSYSHTYVSQSTYFWLAKLNSLYYAMLCYVIIIVQTSEKSIYNTQITNRQSQKLFNVFQHQCN